MYSHFHRHPVPEAGRPRIMADLLGQVAGQPAKVAGRDPGTPDCAGHPPAPTMAMNDSSLYFCYLPADTVLRPTFLLFDPAQLFGPCYTVNNGLQLHKDDATRQRVCITVGTTTLVMYFYVKLFNVIQPSRLLSY